MTNTRYIKDVCKPGEISPTEGKWAFQLSNDYGHIIYFSPFAYDTREAAEKAARIYTK